MSKITNTKSVSKQKLRVGKFSGKPSVKKKIRIAIAGISVLILFGILFYIFYIVKIAPSQPDYIFPSRPFNEMTKAAIDIRLSQSSNIFQISVVLFGGIWGLFMAKKGEAMLIFNDYPEIIMCLSSISLILLSFWFHILYTEEITEIYADSGMILKRLGDLKGTKSIYPTLPDVFHFNINYLFISQVAFFISGLITTLFTFVSAHKLK